MKESRDILHCCGDDYECCDIVTDGDGEEYEKEGDEKECWR